MTSRQRKNKEVKTTEIEKFIVKGVRVLDNDKNIFAFTLVFNGITFYNLRVFETKDHSKNFISFPSYKGSDGNYYNYYYISFSAEDSESIIDEVFNQLDNKN